jgi:hypothetical protein
MTTDELPIREIFVEHAVASIDGAELLTRVRRRRTRRRRGFVALTTVSLVLIASAVTFAVTRSGGTTAQRISPSGVLADAQTVNFHGVEISVPKSWRVVDADCDDPVDHIVTLDDGASCSDVLINNFPTNLTQVHFYDTTSSFGVAAASLATKEVSVSGQRGSEGEGTVPGAREPSKVLALPEAGVVIAVESSDLTTYGTLLNSARIVAIDENGCAAKVASLAAPAQPTTGSLVPRPPTSASICRYEGLRLAWSVALTTAQTTALAAMLEALPAGLSHPGAGSFEIESRCASEPARGFIIHLRGTDSPLPDVYVHISGCTTLSASNGAATTKIDAPLVDFLTSTAGYGSGFPDPRTLN